MKTKEVMKRCSACGKWCNVKNMKVTMSNQMHRYVCSSKCLVDFYKLQPITKQNKQRW